MAWRDQIRKKRVLIPSAAAVLYAGMWLLTQRIGAPQVRRDLLEGTPPGWIDLSTDTSQLSEARIHHIKVSGYWYCVARTYGPFVVRIDRGWQGGPVSGNGGADLNCWFFGKTFHIYEINHWAS
jgi:hypothetical protein